jgi:hypothetical protein
MNTFNTNKIQLPLNKTLTGQEFSVVDIRLKSGEIVKYLLLDSNGFLLGRVIGGHTGVDYAPLSFTYADVDSFRRRGWAARFGIAKWHRLQK